MAKEESNESFGVRSHILAAEIGIADFIGSLPEISGIFGGNAVPVFAVSDERAAEIIKRRIVGSLKQCVEVAFVRTSGDTIFRTDATGYFADCVFRITVNTKMILGENAERNTLSAASVILDALLLKVLAFPFDENTPVRFGGLERVAEEDGTFSAVLELVFRVKIH